MNSTEHTQEVESQTNATSLDDGIISSSRKKVFVKKRLSSATKAIAISVILSFFIGILAGLIAQSRGSVSEETIRQEIQASFEADKQKIQEQLESHQKLVDILAAYQLVVSKDEAISYLNEKMQVVMHNTKRAQQNVANDPSIKALNAALYSNLLETIQKDGERQLGELKKAQANLQLLPSKQANISSVSKKITQEQITQDEVLPQPSIVEALDTQTQGEEIVEDDLFSNTPLFEEVSTQATEQTTKSNKPLNEHQNIEQEQSKDESANGIVEDKIHSDNMPQQTGEEQEEFALPF